MKTLSVMIMLLVLCSCGGGGSSGGSTPSTREINPVSEEEVGTELSAYDALRLDIEIRKLKDLWERLNENETAVRWESHDSDFRKAFKFGMLLEKKNLRLPSVKVDLILKAFLKVFREGMNPDFNTLARTTLKGELK